MGNPRLKLAKLERSHATRYEQLEEARQQDDEKREAMEEADRLSLVAVAGCLPQPRPESWKGVWPPRRWQGHTSHPPFLPTKLWNHGPKKFKPPDPSQVRTSAAASMPKCAIVRKFIAVRLFSSSTLDGWQSIGVDFDEMSRKDCMKMMGRLWRNKEERQVCLVCCQCCASVGNGSDQRIRARSP